MVPLPYTPVYVQRLTWFNEHYEKEDINKKKLTSTIFTSYIVEFQRKHGNFKDPKK